MSPESKRKKNERKYIYWNELPGGHRKYWRNVIGRNGWLARYIKVVDLNDVTLKFYQEIYDEAGTLIELHEKFPVDTGHQKV